MKDQKHRRRMKRKLRYRKILYRLIRMHNFHFKFIHLILRIYNKKDSLIDTNIETNSFIINSLSEDIKHLKKIIDTSTKNTER